MSKRLKKIVKRSLWVLTLIVFTLTLTMYLLLKYRLKETIQYAVQQETNGCFDLKIGYSNYHFWDDQIVLKNIVLKNKKCFDKATRSIRIKRVTLKLDAIYPLLFGNNYNIENLDVTGVDFSIQLKKKGKKVNLKSEIEHLKHVLAKIGGKFHMENIVIQDANVKFLLKGKQFKLKHIDFEIDQFSKNETTNKFEAVFNIRMDQQRIVIKDNLIEFDQLLLNNNRGLHLSNFKFIQPSPQLKGKYNVFTTKVFHFIINPDFFKNEDLNIDSLYLSKVDVTFQLVKGGIERNIDSVQRQITPTSMFEVFDNVGIKHLKLNDLKLNFPTNKLHEKRLFVSQRSLLIQHLNLNEASGLTCKKMKLLNDHFTITSPLTDQEIRLTEFSFENNTIELIKPQFINKKGVTNTSLKVDKIKFIDLDITKALDLDFQAKRIQIIAPHFVKSYNGREKVKFEFDFSQINALFLKGVHEVAHYFKSDKIELYRGYIDVTNQNKHFIIQQLDMVFNTKKLNTLKSVLELQKTVDKLSIGALFYNDGIHQLRVNNTQLFFLEKNFRIGYLKLNSPKITSEINQLNMSQFDLNEFINQHTINIGKFEVENLDLSLNETKDATIITKVPVIVIDTVFIKKTQFSLNKTKQKIVSFEIDSTYFKGFDYQTSSLSWKNSDAKARNIFINNFNDAIDLEVGALRLKDKHVTLRSIILHNKLDENEIDVDVPLLQIDLKTSSLAKNHLKLEKITFPKSTIKIDFAKLPQKRNQALKRTKKAIELPQMDVDQVVFENIGLNTNFDNKTVQLESKFLLNMTLKEVHQDQVLLTKELQNNLSKLPLSYQLDCKLEGELKQFTYQAMNSAIQKITVQSRTTLNQNDVLKIAKDPVLLADFMRGHLEGFTTEYKQHTIHVNEVFWRSQKEQIQMNGINILPFKTSKEYFEQQAFESVYFRMMNGNLTLNNVSIAEIVKEHKFHFKSVELVDAEIELSKDKTKPFEQGIIKPMFTDLLMNNTYDFDIDVIQFKNIHIPYQELQNKNEEFLTMDLSKLNGKITNVKSHPTATDSLSIDANLYFNDVFINYFFYRESYVDTLSAFRMRLAMGKTDLRKLSSISKPFASLQILSGFCDTLSTSIKGNKLAAFGYMNFKYHDLSVQLDSNERIKSPIMLNLINFTANDFLLNKHNSKPSFVFTERNNERYVFNLWIKSIISGIFTSTGLKSNRSYHKKIKRNREKYYL